MFTWHKNVTKMFLSPVILNKIKLFILLIVLVKYSETPRLAM
jgi:hypothetical protein